MLTGKPFELESSTASARLSALWKAGLVDRAQGAAPSGGKEYKYFAIA
jgi:predicted transcriptional regulator